MESHQQKSLRVEIMNEMYYYQQLLRIIEMQKLNDKFPEAHKEFENLAIAFGNTI
jgi:hypothetical protein